ncbi:hypothetical protein [Prochlorothrix hollandica]|uniref:hypothetical protein n=1 Tax=Prochlorothrix hollandica TaxID=1223 RepID=UPI0033408704
MNTQKQLKTLLAQDPSVSNPIEWAFAKHRNDPNHAQRRQQQRAITNPMITIALAHGQKDHSYGAVRYALTDRSLQSTPYRKFADTLRGLTVIAYPASGQLSVCTTYWDFKIRDRRPKSSFE